MAQCDAAVQVRVGERRVERDRLGGGVEHFVYAAQAQQGTGAVCHGLGGVRAQRQGRVVGGERLGRALVGEQEGAAGVVCLGEGGVERDGAVQAGERVGAAAELEQGLAEICGNGGGGGVGGGGLRQALGGGVGVAGREVDEGEAVQCVGVSGVGGEEVGEDGRGGGRLAGGDAFGGAGEVFGALGGGPGRLGVRRRLGVSGGGGCGDAARGFGATWRFGRACGFGAAAAARLVVGLAGGGAGAGAGEGWGVGSRAARDPSAGAALRPLPAVPDGFRRGLNCSDRSADRHPNRCWDPAGPAATWGYRSGPPPPAVSAGQGR